MIFLYIVLILFLIWLVDKLVKYFRWSMESSTQDMAVSSILQVVGSIERAKHSSPFWENRISLIDIKAVDSTIYSTLYGNRRSVKYRGEQIIVTVNLRNAHSGIMERWCREVRPEYISSRFRKCNDFYVKENNNEYCYELIYDPCKKYFFDESQAPKVISEISSKLHAQYLNATIFDYNNSISISF